MTNKFRFAQDFYIMIQQGSQTVRKYYFKKGSVKIGRADDNEIVLADDLAVSRYHALITSKRLGYSLKNLKSKNAIYLNGRILEDEQNIELAHCDELIIGHTIIQFLIAELIRPQFIIEQIIENGPCESILINQAITNIGRKVSENDLIINNRTISFNHAKITFKNGQFFLQDSGSINKSYINGVQLDPDKKANIEHNDIIKFGELCFRFFQLFNKDSSSFVHPHKEPTMVQEESPDFDSPALTRYYKPKK